MASHDDEAAVVANGDARTDAFYTIWGDGDGHSMPLSPTVRVRYKTLYIHCYNYHHFHVFTLVYVATCW